MKKKDKQLVEAIQAHIINWDRGPRLVLTVGPIKFYREPTLQHLFLALMDEHSGSFNPVWVTNGNDVLEFFCDGENAGAPYLLTRSLLSQKESLKNWMLKLLSQKE